jgi:hypothetical protein
MRVEKPLFKPSLNKEIWSVEHWCWINAVFRAEFSSVNPTKNTPILRPMAGNSQGIGGHVPPLLELSVGKIFGEFSPLLDAHALSHDTVQAKFEIVLFPLKLSNGVVGCVGACHHRTKCIHDKKILMDCQAVAGG